jgi:hypothetical protein
MSCGLYAHFSELGKKPTFRVQFGTRAREEEQNRIIEAYHEENVFFDDRGSLPD